MRESGRGLGGVAGAEFLPTSTSDEILPGPEAGLARSAHR